MTSAVSRQDRMSVIDEIFFERPAFHIDGGRDVSSLAAEGTLRLLESSIGEGMRTLETGCGASTVVFATAGTIHTVVSPLVEEQDRVRSYCSRHGIDTSSVSFIVSGSDEVLPTLDAEFDVAFIDGAHSFPYPAVDWHYVRRLLRIGGLLFLDDTPIPAVGVVAQYLASSAGWELVAVTDYRATIWRKIADEPAGDSWRMQAFNDGYPDYCFLPFRDRMRIRLARMRGGIVRRIRCAARALSS